MTARAWPSIDRMAFTLAPAPRGPQGVPAPGPATGVGRPRRGPAPRTSRPQLSGWTPGTAATPGSVFRNPPAGTFAGWWPTALTVRADRSGQPVDRRRNPAR